MMLYRLLCFITIFCLAFQIQSNAQALMEDRVFRGGLLAGFNVSQVDGDQIKGFNKFGFAGGVTSFIRLHERFSLNINIEYGQKGARSTVDNTPPNMSYNLSLDYIDVPFIVHFHHFERVMIGAGLSVNTLVRWNEYVNDFPAHEAGSTPYSRFDLMGVASIGYFFNHHFGADFRYSYTIIPVRPHPPTTNEPFWRSRQYNNALSFRLIYLI